MSGADTSQLDLFEQPVSRSGDDVIGFLNEGSRLPVLVKFTRNRVSMVAVSFRHEDRIVVRLNAGFLRAPETVLCALRRYLRSRRTEAWRLVVAYAARIGNDGDVSPRPRRVQPKGRIYDLAVILRDVKRDFFNSPVSCRIGWGKRGVPTGKRRRSIRFGSWSPGDRVITVHPSLDSDRVPVEFVRYIVFHELLHAVVPEKRQNGRRYDHTPEFRALERHFPNYDEMQALAKLLVGRL